MVSYGVDFKWHATKVSITSGLKLKKDNSKDQSIMLSKYS